MINNIVFDIGNVLTDFRWFQFLQDKGFRDDEAESIGRASVLTPVWAELDRGVWTFEQVMAGFVKNAPELEEMLHKAFDDMSGIVTIRPYVIQWVREWKRKGMKVYYLSNFSEKIERECMDALVFREEMDGGIMSYQDKLIKPDPAIYQLLLARYGLRPEECVFLDDLPVNVEAARSVGMHGVIFEDREQATREVELLL